MKESIFWYNTGVMEPTILVNKPLGVTPLEAIQILQQKYPQFANQTIGYAGRLDPMAEGLLLLLIGEENKKRKKYEDLPKTYEFSMLVGVSTDTYDLMGLITHSAKRLTQSEEVDLQQLEQKVNSLLPSFIGNLTLPYPPYSSRTVNGIPLYKYARENRLDTIEIPRKKVTISLFELLSSSLLPSSDLLSHISRIIPTVKGDFRQEEIVTKWHDNASYFPAHFSRLSFRITCSSGTYIREIVHELGEKIEIPTVTFSITRTHIGNYSLEEAFSLK